MAIIIIIIVIITITIIIIITVTIITSEKHGGVFSDNNIRAVSRTKEWEKKDPRCAFFARWEMAPVELIVLLCSAS